MHRCRLFATRATAYQEGCQVLGPCQPKATRVNSSTESRTCAVIQYSQLPYSKQEYTTKATL
jgi:hypothetical protein